MDTIDERSRPAGRGWGRGWRGGLVAAGAAFGMTLAGLGIADAQTDGTTTAPPDPSVEQAPAPGPDERAEGRKRRPLAGLRGVAPHKPFGAGGPGIHGEFTTRGPDGGFQVIATQEGEVTAVSGSSITVKSVDDYSRTYVVNDDTLVNAGKDGIADVARGDRVHVVAVVTDGNAAAKSVFDITKIRESRERWHPAPRDDDETD